MIFYNEVIFIFYAVRNKINIYLMVPRAGLEPAQRERRGILNPLCLPIPPPRHILENTNK